MRMLFTLMIFFGGLLLTLSVIGGIILFIIKLVREGISGEKRRMHTDEARMVQEIYKGLSEMEARIEALETLLLDRERERKEKKNEPY